MRNLMNTRVRGPLARYRDGYIAELVGQGYLPEGAVVQVQLMGRLSDWLEGQGLGSLDLTPERAREFVRDRRARGYTKLSSEKSVRPLLGYLDRLGVLPPPPPRACTPLAKLVEDYRNYL